MRRTHILSSFNHLLSLIKSTQDELVNLRNKFIGTRLTKFSIDRMGFWSTINENTSLHIDKIAIDQFFGQFTFHLWIDQMHLSLLSEKSSQLGSQKCFANCFKCLNHLIKMHI